MPRRRGPSRHRPRASRRPRAQPPPAGRAAARRQSRSGAPPGPAPARRRRPLRGPVPRRGRPGREGLPGPLRARDPQLYLLRHRLGRPSTDVEVEVSDFLVERETPPVTVFEAVPARPPQGAPGVAGPPEQDADILAQKDRGHHREPLAVFGALDDPAPAGDDALLGVEGGEERVVLEVAETALAGAFEDLRNSAAGLA